MEPGSGPQWEPDWMKELREIDAHISINVERHIRGIRRGVLLVALGGMVGYLVSFAVVELLRWKLGLK